MKTIDYWYEFEIGFYCPYCKGETYIDTEDCGRVVKCEHCGKKVKIKEWEGI